MSPGQDLATLTFACVSDPPRCDAVQHVAPLNVSRFVDSDGQSLALLYRSDACDLLRFTHVADFYLSRDSIICHLLDPRYDYLVEIRLLGPVLSFWLECQGVVTLHASAVALDEGCVAFGSGNRSGKTALAASFVEAGYPLLTDDVLAIDRADSAFLGRPSYPSMRMWPDQACHFLADCGGLEKVHPDYSKLRVPVGVHGFGTFSTESQPIACFYLPEKCEEQETCTEIRIESIPPREAVVELLRNSFSARLVEAAGLQGARLHLLARMAAEVPVRRIVYPHGFRTLPAVREAILADLEQLSRNRC